MLKEWLDKINYLANSSSHKHFCLQSKEGRIFILKRKYVEDYQAQEENNCLKCGLLRKKNIQVCCYTLAEKCIKK